ncbi:hypothetical protein [Cellulomonas sp. NS3]|uniref:hypothetical protein n=1 Tax=Cellulomonas sp. NS3 TaxID=2973977 RepID=UPI00216295A0|nr:hypothetical protein [Cellulomonas sp. NS3]
MGYADQPRYSPNGRFFWDGHRWTPVEDRLWDVDLPSAVDTAEPGEPGAPCAHCGASPGRRSFGDVAVVWLISLVISLGVVTGGLATYVVAAP